MLILYFGSLLIFDHYYHGEDCEAARISAFLIMALMVGFVIWGCTMAAEALNAAIVIELAPLEQISIANLLEESGTAGNII